MSSAKVTTDHEEIRAWVEERGGFPARVKRTGHGHDDPGILRIDFPGFSGEESLERIDWDEWLEAFDENELAFLHQDETAEGDQSRFNKLVSRAGSEDTGIHRKGATRSHGAGRGQHKS